MFIRILIKILKVSTFQLLEDKKGSSNLDQSNHINYDGTDQIGMNGPNSSFGSHEGRSVWTSSGNSNNSKKDTQDQNIMKEIAKNNNSRARINEPEKFRNEPLKHDYVPVEKREKPISRSTNPSLNSGAFSEILLQKKR